MRPRRTAETQRRRAAALQKERRPVEGMGQRSGVREQGAEGAGGRRRQETEDRRQETEVFSVNAEVVLERDLDGYRAAVFYCRRELDLTRGGYRLFG